MSSDTRWITAAVPRGSGIALDLGGGAGRLAAAVAARGYAYLNIDVAIPSGAAPRSIIGDAHRLPLSDGSISIVVSSDSLEHFREPGVVLDETRRVLRPGGLLIAWIPFMHPFHGDDYYRYTPLGIRYLFGSRGFEISSITSPLGAVSVIAQMLSTVAHRLRLPWLERGIERTVGGVDASLSTRRRVRAYATHYLVVASRGPDGASEGSDRAPAQR